jgi:hypothetical protein
MKLDKNLGWIPKEMNKFYNNVYESSYLERKGAYCAQKRTSRRHSMGGGGGAMGGGVSGAFSLRNVCIFPPLGLHFVRFLKQIFGYTPLHYTVDTVCLCKYHNSVTNLFSLAFHTLGKH